MVRAPLESTYHQLLATCNLLDSVLTLAVSGWPQIEGLARFMPQLLHIRQPGVGAAAAGFPNVGSAGSLMEVFQTS